MIPWMRNNKCVDIVIKNERRQRGKAKKITPLMKPLVSSERTGQICGMYPQVSETVFREGRKNDKRGLIRPWSHHSFQSSNHHPRQLLQPSYQAWCHFLVCLGEAVFCPSVSWALRAFSFSSRLGPRHLRVEGAAWVLPYWVCYCLMGACCGYYPYRISPCICLDAVLP